MAKKLKLARPHRVKKPVRVVYKHGRHTVPHMRLIDALLTS